MATRTLKKAFKTFLSLTVVGNILLFHASAIASNRDIWQARGYFEKAQTYYKELQKEYEASENLVELADDRLSRLWLSNWRLYDKERDLDIGLKVRNQELGELRDEIGLLNIQIVHFEHQMATSAKSIKALETGEGLTPGDGDDLGKYIRPVKLKAARYRHSYALVSVENLTKKLRLKKISYSKRYNDLKRDYGPVYIYQPKLSEIEVAERKLRQGFSSTALSSFDRPMKAEIAFAAEHYNDVSFNYLKELLELRPVQVESFEVNRKLGPWYKYVLKDSASQAVVERGVSAETISQAFDEVRQSAEFDIDTLKFDIDRTDKLVKELGEAWSSLERKALTKDSKMADYEKRVAYVNTGLEAGSFLLTLYLSGGVSMAVAPSLLTQLGDAAFRGSVKAAAPIISSATGPALNAMVKSGKFLSDPILRNAPPLAREISWEMFSAVSKALKEPLVQSAETIRKEMMNKHAREFWYGAMHNARVGPTKYGLWKASNKDFFISYFLEMGDKEKILIGDALESVITNVGFDDLTDTWKIGKVIAADPSLKGLSTADAVRFSELYITAATTTLKFVNQAIFDEVNAQWLIEKAGISAEAGVYKEQYWHMVNIRNALKNDLAYKEKFLESLDLYEKYGSPKKAPDIVHNNKLTRDKVDAIGQYDFTVKFSRPVTRPIIKANGVTFSTPLAKDDVKENRPNTIWNFAVDSFNLPNEATEIKIEIMLGNGEPYPFLDTNPETPLYLTKIDADGWAGYEKGVSTHILRIGLEEDPLAGIDDAAFPEVLVPELGPSGCEHLSDNIGLELGTLDRTACELDWLSKTFDLSDEHPEAKTGLLEGLSENASKNLRNENALQLGNDLLPDLTGPGDTLTGVDNIIPDISGSDDLINIPLAPRLDDGELNLNTGQEQSSDEDILSFPETSEEMNLIRSPTDLQSNIPLGIDQNNSTILSAPLIGLAGNSFDFGELEGTPLGELILKLGPDSPVITTLTSDGIQDEDQAKAKTILDAIQ